jgi:hypothetical protein
MATLQNILELAKHGSPKAIAVLMNRHLRPKGIIVKAGLRDGCLQVLLESALIPDQSTLVAFIRKGVMNLGTEAIKSVKVYGKQTSEEFPAWIQEFELVRQTVPISLQLSSEERGRVSTSTPQLKSEASQLTQKPSPSPQSQNLSPLASSNLRKNQTPLGLALEKILAGINFKSFVQNFQTNLIKDKKNNYFLKRILGVSILTSVLLVIGLLSFKQIALKEESKKAECETTYIKISNKIKNARSDVAKFPLNQKGLQSQANRIDKLVVSLKSEVSQLQDETLKLITNQFITEAKSESASLRKIASMENAKSKLVNTSAKNKLAKKIEFENERSIQSLFNQFSLMKDGNTYCK